MRRIVWAQAALSDLAGIRAYIGQFNPTAAVRVGGRLVQAADSLAELPERGRPISGHRRELAAIPPYLIRYRVSGNTVFILRVRHGARRPD